MKTDLTRLEKTLVSFAIADAINKEEKKLERIKKRIREGVKEYGNITEGRRDINKEYAKSMKVIDVLDSARKKIGC